MSIEVFWQLPVQGDGRAIGPELWTRGDYSAHRKTPHPFARTGVQRDGYTFYDHLSQIAGAVDLARFDGLWIPQSAAGEDPLIVAGAFAREAPHLKLVPALRAPLLSAVYATKIAVSFQRLTGGRLAWYLHNEEDQPETWHGRHWSLAEQVARTGEFLDVAKGFWNAAPFTYRGSYYEVENGGFPPPLQGETLPLVYLSGLTDEALELGARHADVYLLPIAPPGAVQERIVNLDGRAARYGRRLRYGLLADLVARQTDEEAWADLRRRWEELAARTVPLSLSVPPPALPAFDELVADANLWTGFGRVRQGAAAGLVGGYDALTERIRDYARLGVETFVFSANPALEEAYRVGEKLLPRLRAIGAQPPAAKPPSNHRPANPQERAA
jgi:alkanesulfonate monooxygenase